jgi:hypothetical protein
MRKIKIPVKDIRDQQGWVYLTTEQLINSAIEHDVDDESFEFSLNSFCEASISASSYCKKFKAEARRLWRNRQQKATNTASQYIN